MHSASLGLTVSTFSSAALRHFRFWSISLICSSISRQRLLVTVTGGRTSQVAGRERGQKGTQQENKQRNGKKKIFTKWEENTTMVVMCHAWEGHAREAHRTPALCHTRPRRCRRRAGSRLPSPSSSQPVGSGQNGTTGLRSGSHFSLRRTRPQGQGPSGAFGSTGHLLLLVFLFLSTFKTLPTRYEKTSFVTCH